MPNSRTRRTATLICFALLLLASLATNTYLAHRITYPPRTLRVRIIFDPANPPIAGMLPEHLQARVEALNSFFQEAADIRISVVGFTRLKLPPQSFDPDALRRFAEIHTPRDNADVLVAFWPPPPGDQRLGSAVPYSPVGIVRIDVNDPQKQDPAILAHQILSLFGVPVSSDPKSVMHVPPTALHLDSASAKDLMETRLFDFARGLGGMTRRMQGHVLASLQRTESAGSQPGAPSKPARMALAELFMRDSQFPAAIEQYRAAVRADGNSVAAHMGLAAALTQAAQYPEAEAEARAAIKLAPKDGDTHYRLGSVLVRSSNPEAAISEFRQAIALQPNSGRNRTGLAVAYAASIGEFDAADREFHEALKLDPQNAGLLADIDFVNRLRARLTKQLAAAETEVRANPASGDAHDSLALLLLRLGQVEKATGEAREALRLGPDTWRPHYSLALALYARHDYAGSAAAMADAKKLGSGSRPFLEEALRGK